MTTQATFDTPSQNGEGSTVDKSKYADMIDAAFADLYNYTPTANGLSLLQTETFLSQRIQDDFVLPPNHDVKIEDLTEEDMHLPDGFL